MSRWEGSNAKVIKCTWLGKFYKGRTARLPTSSGMFAYVSMRFIQHIFISSLGMTMLETATNIVVPDQ